MLNAERFIPCIPHEQINSELSEPQIEKLFSWLFWEEILQNQPLWWIYVSDLDRWINKYNWMTGGFLN